MRQRSLIRRPTASEARACLEHLMRDLFAPTHRGLHQFGGFHDLRAGIDA